MCVCRVCGCVLGVCGVCEVGLCVGVWGGFVCGVRVRVLCVCFVCVCVWWVCAQLLVQTVNNKQ